MPELNFKHYQFDKGIILTTIRWYVAYKLSYRDIMRANKSVEGASATIAGVELYQKLRRDQIAGLEVETTFERFCSLAA